MFGSADGLTHREIRRDNPLFDTSVETFSQDSRASYGRASRFHLKHWDAIQALVDINGHRPSAGPETKIRSYILCGVRLHTGVKTRFHLVPASHIRTINRRLEDELYDAAGPDPIPPATRETVYEVDTGCTSPFADICSTFFPFAGVAGKETIIISFHSAAFRVTIT